MINFIFKITFILISISIFLSCSKEEDASPGNIKSTTNTGSNQNTTSPASNNSSESNGDTGPTNPINEDFKCGNGFYYSSRPEPNNEDNTHRYYEYVWQSDPAICLNIYEESLLGNRVNKVSDFFDWAKLNMPNMIPVNVFYIDQENAGDQSKLQHDTDFCTLVRNPDDIGECIAESRDSWGERSHGAGVYASYLHKGADLMIYDDAFKHSGGVDEGMYYLNHEYFHTFQTGHMYYFEEKKQFGIRIKDESDNIPLPFLPIWIGEGGADFASITMMAKQNLNFDPYKQALSKLDQARAALQGSSASFSLRNFENENIRVNDEYYAYGGGTMAHIYLWHLNENNFKKLIVDYYSIFAEKYKLNPQSGWKDAFEETFGITLENFYLEFDAFMRKDRDSQIAIIKSAEEWEKASWN